MFGKDYPSIGKRCILSALIAIMMWIKMLDWLRLFDGTAFYIKLIVKTLSDVLPFFVIFIIFIFMFGSSLYILNMNR